MSEQSPTNLTPENARDMLALSEDLLEGAANIGAFMGLEERKIRYLEKRLPIFRVGTKMFARKSTLLAWIREQERRIG